MSQSQLVMGLEVFSVWWKVGELQSYSQPPGYTDTGGGTVDTFVLAVDGVAVTVVVADVVVVNTVVGGLVGGEVVVG